MNKAKMATIALAASALLGGCASLQNGNVQSQQAQNAEGIENPEALVDRNVSESARNIQRTLQYIEKIERGQATNSQGVLVAPAAPMAPEAVPAATAAAQRGADEALGSLVKMNWEEGDAQALLKKIAAQYGFGFKTSGAAQDLPKVTLVGEMTLRQAFEQIGRQIDVRADIVLVKATSPAVVVLKFKN